MSLINDVLRDLDARRRQPDAAVGGDTLPAAPRTRRTRAGWVLLALAPALVTGAWISWSSRGNAPPAVESAPPPAVARIAPRATEPPPESEVTIPDPHARVPDAVATRSGRDGGPGAIANASGPERESRAVATDRRAGPEASATAPEAIATAPDLPGEPHADAPARADASSARREPAPAASASRGAPRRHARDVDRAHALYSEALRVAERHPAAARDLLFRALEAAPRHRASREALATLLARAGEPSAALTILATGRRHDPEHLGYLEVEARVRAAHGDVEAAIDTLERALVHREDAELLALLATLERERGRHARAAAHYRAALRLAPERGSLWLGLGVAEESLGDRRSALASYRRALRAGLAPASRAWTAERTRALGGG